MSRAKRAVDGARVHRAVARQNFCYSGAVAKGLLLYARSVAYNYNGGAAQHFALAWVNSAANKLLLSYQLNTRKC